MILCCLSFIMNETKVILRPHADLQFLLSEINILTIYPAEKPELSVDAFSKYLKRIQLSIDTSGSYTINKSEIGQVFVCAKTASKSTFPCPKAGMLGIGTNKSGENIYLCFDPFTPYCFFVLNEKIEPVRMSSDSCLEYYNFWKEYLHHRTKNQK